MTPAGSTRLRLLPGGLLLILALAVDTAVAADRLSVQWQPAKPRVGDVALMLVRGAPDDATLEGMVDGRPLTFFPYAGGRAALVGFDLEVKAGVKPWRLAVLVREGDARTASGKVRVAPRTFPVQRLSLPSGMVDLEAGRYVAACFLPTGATPENMPAIESGQHQGAAHYTEGMVQVLTVT